MWLWMRDVQRVQYFIEYTVNLIVYLSVKCIDTWQLKLLIKLVKAQKNSIQQKV